MLESIQKLLSDHDINIGITIGLLLQGNQDICYTINTKIFDIVHGFICDTARQP